MEPACGPDAVCPQCDIEAFSEHGGLQRPVHSPSTGIVHIVQLGSVAAILEWCKI